MPFAIWKAEQRIRSAQADAAEADAQLRKLQNGLIIGALRNMPEERRQALGERLMEGMFALPNGPDTQSALPTLADPHIELVQITQAENASPLLPPEPSDDPHH